MNIILGVYVARNGGEQSRIVWRDVTAPLPDCYAMHYEGRCALATLLDHTVLCYARDADTISAIHVNAVGVGATFVDMLRQRVTGVRVVAIVDYNEALALTYMEGRPA